MISSTPRVARLLLAVTFVMSTALVTASPATAADSPEGAVQELVAMVASGDLSGIDQSVCAAERDAVMQQFDPGIALGVGDDQNLLDAFTFQVDDAVIDVLSQEADSAQVHLTAKLTIDIDESRARDLVKAMLEAEGEPVTDEDIDFVLPLMLSAFGEGQDIDEELTVVLENGQWLVCGGLSPDQPDTIAPEASITFDGLCGLVSIAELNAVGHAALQFDSNFAVDDYCSYSPSSFEDYYSLSLNLGRDEQLEPYRTFFPEGSEITIGETPAWIDANQLFIGTDIGVLQMNLFPGEEPPADFDPDTYLANVAALYLPVLDSLEPPAEVGPIETEPLVDGPALCDSLSLGELSDVTGIPFEELQGDGDYCSYFTLDPSQGYNLVSTSINYLGIDELTEYFPGGETLDVEGRPAYLVDEQLWVELDDSGRTLLVGTYIDDTSGQGLDPVQVAIDVAVATIPNVPESSDPFALSNDLDDLGVEEEGPALCSILDLDALDGLSVLQYDDAYDGGAELCIVSSTDNEAGVHSLTLWRDISDIADVRQFYPGGSGLTVSGRDAYSDGQNLWLEADGGTVVISAEFSGVPAAADLDHDEYVSAIAELVAAGLDAAE